MLPDVPGELAFARSVRSRLPLLGPLKAVLGLKVPGRGLILVAFQKPTQVVFFLQW